MVLARPGIHLKGAKERETLSKRLGAHYEGAWELMNGVQAHGVIAWRCREGVRTELQGGGEPPEFRECLLGDGDLLPVQEGKKQGHDGISDPGADLEGGTVRMC